MEICGCFKKPNKASYYMKIKFSKKIKKNSQNMLSDAVMIGILRSIMLISMLE